MTTVASMPSFEATPRSTGAEEEIGGSVQAPYLTRQSLDALDALRPPQRLVGLGSISNSILDPVGREGRHDDRWCHARQREKRGVSLRGGTLIPLTEHRIVIRQPIIRETCSALGLNRAEREE